MTRDSLSGTSDDTARNAIDALRDAWVAAVAAGDAGALRDMVTPDYEVWAHGAPTLAGPDAVVGAMRAALAKYAITQSYEPIETVVSGDWGFQRGIERIRAVPLDGGPGQRRHATRSADRSPRGGRSLAIRSWNDEWISARYGCG
jgi:ketosteroid isomerase-like protein